MIPECPFRPVFSGFLNFEVVFSFSECPYRTGHIVMAAVFVTAQVFFSLEEDDCIFLFHDLIFLVTILDL